MTLYDSVWQCMTVYAHHVWTAKKRQTYTCNDPPMLFITIWNKNIAKLKHFLLLQNATFSAVNGSRKAAVNKPYISVAVQTLCVWQCMTVYDSVWLCMTDCVWQCMTVYDSCYID